MWFRHDPYLSGIVPVSFLLKRYLPAVPFDGEKYPRRIAENKI
jgi:hypothetical protein